MNTSETYKLSLAQIQFFEDNGYLVVKKLIDQADLNSYRERFVAVCKRQISATVVKDYELSKTTSNPENYINKIQDLLYDEVFCTYPENPHLIHIVSQLIGDNLTAANCMLINKPPGTNLHAPHQDLIYFPFRPAHKILASWTPIDPVSKANGCLFVLPGSHKPRELLDHSHEANDGKQFFFSVTNWDRIATEDKRVYLEMDPGDTVFLSSTLIHGSLPNTTEIYRKAMTCHFANSDCHYIEMGPGSKQEVLANMVEEELKQRGAFLKYADVWKLKMKAVKGVRCNL